MKYGRENRLGRERYGKSAADLNLFHVSSYRRVGRYQGLLLTAAEN